MSSVLVTVLPLILAPLLVSVLTYYGTDLLKRLWSALDRLPADLKSGVAGTLSAIWTALIALVTTYSGLELPLDITQWDVGVVTAVIGWLLSMKAKDRQRLQKHAPGDG